MKIIENNWNQSKEVAYKGNTLIVPISPNWVAVNANGGVASFEEKPYCIERGSDGGWWESISEFGDLLGKAEFEEDKGWKQSLEYVGE